MNSAAFDAVERLFAGRPVFDIVATARVLARGHASHALFLKEQPQTRRGLWQRTRAEQLADFWGTVGLHFGVLDLVEEHAELPQVLRSSLERYAQRQGRDVVDPPGFENPSPDPARLLPPAEHLPRDLPAALIKAFGAHLRPDIIRDWNET